jgi:hydroxyethylthiazole kinase
MTEAKMYDALYQMVAAIKQNRPLILNITNQVTMDFIANGLLSLGASPIMSQSFREVDDLLKLVQGVTVNIGTLDDAFVTLCEQVCQRAWQCGKPVVLDPVGAGASQYRTQTCLQLLKQYPFAAIRGNASEILALWDASHHHTKGVDTQCTAFEAIEAAQALSEQYQTIVIISGPTDVVIANKQSMHFARGSSMMAQVTGSGCLLTAVVSAFQAVSTDAYQAACAAVLFFSVCGELAARQAKGPGSFKSHFLDVLSDLPKREDYES